MYKYDSVDQRVVDERVAQFRDQTRRYLSKELSEDDFRALRLRNGLYIQRFAPMLRIAIPYGNLSSIQLRKLAALARRYDRAYGHFTTRQNIQLNWPQIKDVPDILAELATVQMHAIQTSGNCVRNVTSDQLAGVAADELEDPRPYCELLRQWSTLHPEFTYLPRKFKIAVSGSSADRAATEVHDIGLHLVKEPSGQLGFKVLVGGGLGRTPILGQVIREFLPVTDLLTYIEAILRVYNLHGRRDNIHKARIKILVKSLGIDVFREQVEAEWLASREFGSQLTQEQVDHYRSFFIAPEYADLENIDPLSLWPSRGSVPASSNSDSASSEARHVGGSGESADVAPERVPLQPSTLADFKAWLKYNTVNHKMPGYRVVLLSLKSPGVPPGDLTSDQMEGVADLADRVSFGELRVTHGQNLVFADVEQRKLLSVWQELKALQLATPNLGTLTDMIVCPGLDFCSLANAGTLSVAAQIQRHFDDYDYLYDIGEIELKMSGCMNACGHHHVGHIGILGVDKHGEAWYQITIGGSAREGATLGQVIGPSVPQAEVASTLKHILDVYRELRQEDERFIDTVRRTGVAPFKERVYG